MKNLVLNDYLGVLKSENFKIKEKYKNQFWNKIEELN